MLTARGIVRVVRGSESDAIGLAELGSYVGRTLVREVKLGPKVAKLGPVIHDTGRERVGKPHTVHVHVSGGVATVNGQWRVAMTAPVIGEWREP